MKHKSYILFVCALTVLSGCRTEERKIHHEAESASVSVIASVMGYEAYRRLPDGQNVITINSNKNEVKDTSGFLFRVLYPAQYRGRMFRLHHDGTIASGDPVRLYDIDKVYEFKVYPEDLIREAGCSLRPLGREVNASELAKAELQMQKQVLVYQLNDFKARWKLIQTKSSATILKNREYFEEKIKGLETKLMELDERIKIESEKTPQPSDTPNPQSPSAPGAGGR